MNFTQLEKKYSDSTQEDIENLYNLYAKRKVDTLIDALGAAVGLSSIVAGGKINYEALTPQMEEAFQLSFPNKSMESLIDLEVDSLSGILSNWKGKLFEVKVRDQLNDGALVGDIQLAEGQYAELAEQINQPGWDLQIFNEDGSIDNFFQLKATESMSYINEALEKYPDIEILSTEEVADFTTNLLGSDITNQELNDSLAAVVDESTDFLDYLLPGIPFLIITLAEGRKVFVKKQDFETAIANTASRSLKTGGSIVAGLLAFDITGLSWLGMATAAIVRLLFGNAEKKKKYKKMTYLLETKNKELLLLNASYN